MTKESIKNLLKEETKYSKYYLLIIEKSKLDNRKKLKKDNKNYIYYENHHILPSSLFPDYKDLKINKWNSVLLTAKEHYICHALIWKHYKKLNSKEQYSMSYAFCHMNTKRGENQRTYRYNSKLYEYCKINFKHSEESKIKMRESCIGRIISEETRLKISNANKGRIIPHKERVKMSLALRNKKTIKAINKITNTVMMVNKEEFDNDINLIGFRKGMKLDKTTLEKLSIARKGLLKGSNNPSAKNIIIYDDTDIPMYNCHGNFKQTCIDNNLPFEFLTKSYQNNIKIKFTKSGKGATYNKAVKSGKIKYDGWYAKVV